MFLGLLLGPIWKYSKMLLSNSAYFTDLFCQAQCSHVGIPSWHFLGHLHVCLNPQDMLIAQYVSGILLGPGARIVNKTSALFSQSLQGMFSKLLDSPTHSCSSHFTEGEGEAAVDIGPCVPLYHQSCSWFNKIVFVLNYSVHTFPQSNLYSETIFHSLAAQGIRHSRSQGQVGKTSEEGMQSQVICMASPSCLLVANTHYEFPTVGSYQVFCWDLLWQCRA